MWSRLSSKLVSLEQTFFAEMDVMVSVDVVSLFTNVPVGS